MNLLELETWMTVPDHLLPHRVNILTPVDEFAEDGSRVLEDDDGDGNPSDDVIPVTEANVKCFIDDSMSNVSQEWDANQQRKSATLYFRGEKNFHYGQIFLDLLKNDESGNPRRFLFQGSHGPQRSNVITVVQAIQITK